MHKLRKKRLILLHNFTGAIDLRQLGLKRIPVLGDAPGVEVQEDLSFAAEFLDEFENCFGEVEPVVVGEAVVDLFEKAVFSDF